MDSPQEDKLAMDANLIIANPKTDGFKISFSASGSRSHGAKICILLNGEWVFIPVEPILRHTGQEG
jgi:hypothetical protein